MAKKLIGSTGLVQHTDKFEGIYRGIVMDNDDPDQLGRIKVKVYPMLEGVETDILPWATPASPLFEGAGEDIGCFTVPRVDANVFVFFEMGDIYQPVYFAEAQDRLKGLPTERTINYPNRKVMKTESGVKVIIDDTTKMVEITTPEGFSLKLDEETLSSVLKTALGSMLKIQDDNPDEPLNAFYALLKTFDDYHFRADSQFKYVEMKTKNGIIFRLSDDDNSATITHPSGAYLILDTAGNWFMKGTTIQLNPV